MKKENNSIDKINLLSKIKSWCYHLFHLKGRNELTNNQEDIVISNNIPELTTFEKYRLQNERLQCLLKLQEDFEKGAIQEESINEKDKLDLESLYKEQINNLKRNIKNVEVKIQKLKKI